MEFIEEQRVSIVANGNFNPAIFQPAWLRSQDIIRTEEEEAATIGVIHPEITKFQVPGLTFEIQTERVVFTAVAEPFVRVCDIFYETFFKKLSHTPIESLGLNYGAHVRLNDWKQRNRFGRQLAPLEPWGDLGRAMDNPEKERAGGLSTLTMKIVPADQGEEGSINVGVQPSVRIPDDVGVFFNVNHHLGTGAFGSDNLVVALYENYDRMMMSSRTIVNDMTTRGRAA